MGLDRRNLARDRGARGGAVRLRRVLAAGERRRHRGGEGVERGAPLRPEQTGEAGAVEDGATIKAHPLSMFQAAERAAELTGAPVHLVMLGYFAVEGDRQHFEKLAADVCRKAKVTFVPNLDPRFPDGLWAAGDIFISLVENMQESFGLTPIEAMAAGLPRVISDWDGYRDSVTHGEDGFLVTTRHHRPAQVPRLRTCC